MMNQLFFGDNLEVLRKQVADHSVDLIYLDPPFNSKVDYNLLFKSPESDAVGAQVQAFRDTWTWGHEAEWSLAEIMRVGGGLASIISALHGSLGQSDMMAYLVMMSERLQELKRVLKPTGSIYLHCDPTASHYLKIVMDGIFSPIVFQGELIWKRTNSRNTKGKWPRLHDTILYYSATPKKLFNPQFAAADQARLPHTLINKADGNKYQTYELTGAGVTKLGESGKAWRGFNPSALGRHWGCTRDELERLDFAGEIHWPKGGGWPRRIDSEPFDPATRKVIVGDVWTDIDRLNQKAKERLGYPTQKPVALLDRIVLASSNPGDVVLDPFCGCGTTVHSAQANGRNWIGIDIAFHAVRVIEDRLMRTFGASCEYSTSGIPRDIESARRLAENDKFQFQWWANYLVGVHSFREVRKGPDRGIDGDMFFMNGPGKPWGRILTSVKGGKSPTVAEVRDFRGVLAREKAEMGLFICLRRPTAAMASDAAAGGYVKTAHGSFPRLQIVSIEEWFEGYRPDLPSMGHIARTAFERGDKKAKKPDPRSPELPFVFSSAEQEQDGVVVHHLNPQRVIRESA